ncbi:hypothetical protein WME89_07765 [Sorangium sp. So ce321]|uniref:hypothetical protein n=1 Tax=Sorangium sp. So ce321 TaxID=3133300 RepID=UPI003F60A09B
MIAADLLFGRIPRLGGASAREHPPGILCRAARLAGCCCRYRRAAEQPGNSEPVEL